MKKINKKIYLKRNIQNIIEYIIVTSIFMILVTIESEWTLNYGKFVLFHLGIATIGIVIIKKFGRKVSD